jgi:5-methylcytosine-specific restriction protein B
MNLAEILLNLCQSRAAWNASKTSSAAVTTKDSRVQATLTELLALKAWLERELLPEFYLNFTVEVSVGRGKAVKVPWLCVLGPGQKVQEGFYIAVSVEPQGRGIVAGVMKSATHPPDVLLTTRKRTPLTEYALDVDSPTYRFNDAFHNPQEFFVDSLDAEAFREHLRESLRLYTELLTEDQPEPIYRRKGRKPTAPRSIVAVHEPAPIYQASPDLGNLVPAFRSACAAAGLLYSEERLMAFFAALLAKPFVILAGLSGSGKTRLAQALARWLNAPYALVAVGPDWTTREPLLGYPDALDPSRYVSTPALELLRSANAYPDQPHFLILDELNLSPVERYGADLLSAMESGEPIFLGGTPPESLPWPSNLFLIGTVNIDETTHPLSPKVLDRAFVLTFDASELTGLLENPLPLRLALLGGGSFPLLPRPLLPRFGGGAGGGGDSEAVLRLHATLTAHDMSFGLRTATEILRFCEIYDLISPSSLDWEEGAGGRRDGLDTAICLKVLPRLHGSQRRLAPVLDALLTLAEVEGWTHTAIALRTLQNRLLRDGFGGYAFE